jgi:hypothetical protein
MWGIPNHIEPQLHPTANFSNLQKAWNNLTATRLAGIQGAILDLWETSLYSVAQQMGLGVAYWIQSGHPSSCSPSDRVKSWEVSYVKRS